MDGIAQSKLAALLSLLTSSGTLVCCALPALLVTLGAGATLSSLVSAVPQLVRLSEHKEGVFFTATVMLAIAGYMQWRRLAPALAKRHCACISCRCRFFSLAAFLRLLRRC
jgi:hypothetical protein